MASEASEPKDEARALIASAHALVRELIEEGVSEFPRAAAAEVASVATTAKAAAPAKRAETRESPKVSVAEELTPGPEIPPWGDRRPELEEVQNHLGDCKRCGLCEGRRSIVFGDGNPNADLMFVGEGPGEQEDLRGLPFVGRAGDLLTQMIEKGIGIPRSEVYICNIVKCRPPRNRNPLPAEVSACRPFLDGQIRAVAPKVIVTLGKPAASLLLGRDVAITKIRGTWQSYQDIPLMPTLHPAYVLRQYTTETRRAVWQDLQAAIERTRA